MDHKFLGEASLKDMILMSQAALHHDEDDKARLWQPYSQCVKIYNPLILTDDNFSPCRQILLATF